MDAEVDIELNKMPLIGDDAPSFSADTTMGKISFPDDFKGKWVVLFSHPADFTPVCTSEVATFAALAEAEYGPAGIVGGQCQFAFGVDKKYSGTYSF